MPRNRGPRADKLINGVVGKRLTHRDSPGVASE
jgi:hypothetical protein